LLPIACRQAGSEMTANPCFLIVKFLAWFALQLLIYLPVSGLEHRGDQGIPTASV